MNNHNDNRIRLLEQLLSVDAWHSTFDPENRTSSIHVDVSFIKAKIGSDADCPIRFSLSLKRAEIVVIVPTSEPLLVAQASVARENPLVGEKTTMSTQNGLSGAELEGGLSASSVLKPNLSAKAEFKAETSHEAQIKTKAEISGFQTAQRKNKDGDYCWEVTPALGEALIGKIWNPVENPRLKVKHTGSLDSNIAASCRVEVRCRKEDLIIDEIDSKEKLTIVKRFKENRLAAAEAYIRNALIDRNLKVLEFDEPLEDVVLADVMVAQEVA